MCKNYNLFSLAVVIALTAVTAIAAADPYVCGDADGSGGVDIDDAVYIIDYIFVGGPEPVPYESGDADGSGGVDIDDVVYLINYIFGGGPAPCTGTVTDVDGNMYFTVEIGDQCWMAQNLKVTHYRNGFPIPNVTDGGQWISLSTGACCDYGNDPGNVETYGRLYNWYAVDDSRSIAPEGWHVPSDAEWKQLEMYLGMSQAEADDTGWRGTDEGGKLKEAGTVHWTPPNTGATNESGFSALPGGYRAYDASFHFMGYGALFWSSTEYGSSYAWDRLLSYGYSQVYRYGYYGPDGISVRCVRD